MLRLVVWFLPLLASSLVVVVPPQARLTKRILFVVDVSGSMEGDKFGRASSAVMRIAAQPVDEVEIGVLAFNEAPRRWEGLQEPDDPRPVPRGWAALPSEVAVAEAEAFLAECGAGGGTRVIPALRAALAEERRALSLVLVTDGIFQREANRDVLGALEEGQAAREERGLERAVLLVYGIGEERDVLRQLADAGGGGYYREQVFRAPAVQGMFR